MEPEKMNVVGMLNAEMPGEPFWFCVQTHPKHEHMAASCLARLAQLDVFNPQLRIRRATKRGPVWFTESAFPGYVFARFDLQKDLDVVRYAASVSNVVHFKACYPSIPGQQIEELRAIFEADQTLTLAPNIAPGDTVRIVGGAFHDLLAVVKQVRPAKERVQALLEYLGSITTVELNLHEVVVEKRSQPSNHPLVNSNATAGGGCVVAR